MSYSALLITFFFISFVLSSESGFQNIFIVLHIHPFIHWHRPALPDIYKRSTLSPYNMSYSVLLTKKIKPRSGLHDLIIFIIPEPVELIFKSLGQGNKSTRMTHFLNKDSAIVAFRDASEFLIVDVRDNQLTVMQTVKTPDRDINLHCSFSLYNSSTFLIGGGPGIIKVFHKQG